MTSLHVEFISDYICPWCYIGKVRLDKIKQRLAGEIKIHIQISPFVLYPHISELGEPKYSFANRTKPGMGRSLKSEAALENISFNYKLIESIPYSLHAHRLTWLIKDDEEKYALSKQIFYTYFEEGQDIGNLGVLEAVVISLGLSRKLITYINDEHTIQAVDNYLAQLKSSYISVVPTLRLNRTVVINGLQSEDIWERYFIRASKM